MDSERKTKPNVELPVDDGAIGQALAELDVKLSTWLGAVRAVEGATGTPVPAIAEDAPAPDVIAEPAARTEESREQAPEELGEPEGAEVAVEPVADVAAEAPAEEPTPSSPAAPKSRLMQGARRGPVDEPPSVADSDAVVGLSADDEALLAKLDEKTRAAVLIRRRLYGRTKSVRELLDDISRLGLAQDESKPQSKRWWRR